MAEQIIEKEKVVSITYRITDMEGTVLEQNNVPVSYLHGGKPRIFKKVENNLTGHKQGDRLYITLSPNEAFGARLANLTHTDNIQNVPVEYRRVGAEVEMRNEQGEARVFFVTHIDDKHLTLDANHPMAGKTVTFRVEVTDIRNATEKEIACGESLMVAIGEAGGIVQ